ncbi:hypothetical protein QJS04_geneDACA002819 [Acorus gramineus]|uniref:KIB1-4 beta-propeller domain-containing protein n=1 Tax=Acorus gramineus TaxID=55184 RepID=A0AAV9BYI0_ACOGR|nr:hypothetical protein QJS04_geneDACA002819 [Acorus gramineus]
MPIRNIHERIYLAESPSGLLLIARRIGRTADSITRGFRIFRLHEGATQWLEVCNLDNGMLFLGLNTSFWLSASDFKEGEENSIYFTDDVIAEYCIMEQELDPGNDSGVFHLEDQSFSSICDDDMKLLYPHPVWVVPNP